MEVHGRTDLVYHDVETADAMIVGTLAAQGGSYEVKKTIIIIITSMKYSYPPPWHILFKKLKKKNNNKKKKTI